MIYDDKYYDKKWEEVIEFLPIGGSYRFDLRQNTFDIIKEQINNNERVFEVGCGLAIISNQLEKEKNCFCCGSDFSEIAINYAVRNNKGMFIKTSEIFTDDIDTIIAVHFIEHIQKPNEQLKSWLEKAKRVIFTIPNNFSVHGEHIDMSWNSWDSFYKLFKDFKLTRLDENKYGNIPAGFKAPVFEAKLK